MYLLIIVYWCTIVYGAIQGYLKAPEIMICLGLMLIALIIQDWRKSESKSTFR